MPPCRPNPDAKAHHDQGLVAAQRGNKMGAVLVQGAMERAGPGAKVIFLEVAEDNGHARRLYEGLGFAETGRRRKYYKAGASSTDAIVYGRSHSTRLNGTNT